VGQHGVNGTGHTLGGVTEESSRGETHVGDGGIGHQALQVRLEKDHKRGEKDPHEAEENHQGGEEVRGLGHEEEEDADEAIAPQLQEDASQNHGTDSGGLAVGPGEPDVDRHQGRLEAKGEKDAKPEELGEGQELVQVGLGQFSDDRGPRQGEAEDGEGEEEDAPEEGVEEEDVGGQGLVAEGTPAPDDDKHGDEDGLEKDEEDEEVKGQENAEDKELEEKELGQEGGGVPQSRGYGHEADQEDEGTEDDKDAGEGVVAQNELQV
jgi:hypothetical protein